jgi:hypothetical protein
MESTEPVMREDTTQPTETVQPVQPAPVERREPVYTRRTYFWPNSGSERAIRLVYLVLGIVETLIAIRVVMKLLGANPSAPFTSFIYTITTPLVAFFQGVFAEPQTNNGSVLEISSLLAMVVWALVAWAIVRIILITRRQPPAPTT